MSKKDKIGHEQCMSSKLSPNNMATLSTKKVDRGGGRTVPWHWTKQRKLLKKGKIYLHFRDWQSNILDDYI